MMNESDTHLLTARDLCVRYERSGTLALDHVAFAIERGESVALVGDSGCGKSTLAMAMMRLLPRDATVSGSVEFRGNNVLRMSERELQSVRGGRIAMVFQHPHASLNPVVSVGTQLAEVFRVGQRFNRKEARDEAIAMLGRVGLSDADRLYRAYAHELSGGMAQRVMLAIALARKPDLLIADEPTSGLDSNVQAQIVALLREVQQELRMSLLLITHDMSVAEALADRVCVMHNGAVVDDFELNGSPVGERHPATVRLIEASKRKRAGVAVAGGGGA